MLSDRIPTQQRHQIWSDLCALANQLFELTQLWWRIDHEPAQVHDQRCGVDMTQSELPFGPPEDADLES